MTLPDLPPPRKPPSRWWLFGPYLALLVAAMAWGGAWFWIKEKVRAEFGAIEARSEVNGPSLAWDRMRISGFPFRIEVVLDNPRVSEPSGWGLTAPQLRTETYAYDLKHWIAYAPGGVVLHRPAASPVTITGKAVRASLALQSGRSAQVALQGLDVTFATLPGGRPFPLLAAHELDLHARPAGPDEMEFLIQLTGGRFSSASSLGRTAAGSPASSAWLGTLSQVSALRGRDWPAAAHAWSEVGGAMVVEDGDLDAGPVNISASGGELSVAPDGRLRGGLTLRAARVATSLAALGQSKIVDPALAEAGARALSAQAGVDPTAKVGLTFQDGRTDIGAIDIGPAPRVF